jgi:hypothetical protein
VVLIRAALGRDVTSKVQVAYDPGESLHSPNDDGGAGPALPPQTIRTWSSIRTHESSRMDTAVFCVRTPLS